MTPTQPLDTQASASRFATSEEAQFRARMARLNPDSVGRSRRPGRSGPRGDGFRLGWKSWTAINCVVVLAGAIGALAWPPVSACRQTDRTFGFYAGDSLDKCIRRGITDRLTQMDQRMTMLIRGSGR